MNKVNEVTKRLSELLHKERRIQLAFLSDLDRFDSQQMYLGIGYSSTFSYLTKGLHLSESAAAKRIRVTRAIRKCPVIASYLADGRLHMTAVAMLAKHLTKENCEVLLKQAVHKSKEQLEVILASFSEPDAVPRRDRVKFFSVPTPATKCANHERFSVPAQVNQVDTESPCSKNELFTSAGAVEPRSTPLERENQLFAKIQFSTSLDNYKKLERVKTLLSHKYPHAQLDDILGEVLDCYLKQYDPLTKPIKPTDGSSKATPSKKTQRYIPQAMRQEVYQRDGGTCSFVGAHGKRCGETKFLEYDHIVPLACKGLTEVSNLRLVCRSHNLHAAKQVFGANFIKNKIATSRVK